MLIYNVSCIPVYDLHVNLLINIELLSFDYVSVILPPVCLSPFLIYEIDLFVPKLTTTRNVSG